MDSATTINWTPLLNDEECPCVTYDIEINGLEQASDVPCNQSSFQIENEALSICNNVSVIPRSVHSSIGLLENLGGHAEFTGTVLVD